MGRAVPRGGDAVRPPEARGERADAPQPDGEADVGNGAIGRPEERRGALEPAREEVLVRRLAEGAPELATEVRGRESCRASERGDVERLGVAGVDQVLCTKQVAGRGDDVHPVEYRSRTRASRGAGPDPETQQAMIHGIQLELTLETPQRAGQVELGSGWVSIRESDGRVRGMTEPLDGHRRLRRTPQRDEDRWE